MSSIVGQSEIILIFLITRYYVSEKVSIKETLGIALVAMSGVILLFYT